MKIVKLSFLLLAVMVISLQSCRTIQDLTATDVNGADLNGNWVLTEMNGEDAQNYFAGGRPTMTINTSENRISGYGGCNTYTGSFALNKNVLSAPNLVSTMRACTDNNQEGAFLRLLGSSSSVQMTRSNIIYGDDMLIFTQNGNNVLVFTREKELTSDDLSGDWVLESIEGASPDMYFNEERLPTIKFDSDENRVSGYAGCNTYGGAYTMSNNTLTISQLVTTRMGCERMDGETKMVTLLSGTSDIEIDGNIMYLKRDGKTSMTFRKS